MNPLIKILFIDDAGSVRILFADIFSSSEYEVKLAENGQRALEELNNAEYDVIISDLHISDMSGEEILKKVAEKYPRAGRILISGEIDDWSESKKEETRTRLGVDAIVAKPWKNRELEMIIKKAAEKKRESEIKEHEGNEIRK
jgi:DNA-binding NtrC family response regulator